MPAKLSDITIFNASLMTFVQSELSSFFQFDNLFLILMLYMLEHRTSILTSRLLLFPRTTYNPSITEAIANSRSAIGFLTNHTRQLDFDY
jgi:hypothetical protein